MLLYDSGDKLVTIMNVSSLAGTDGTTSSLTNMGDDFLPI